MFGFYEFQMTVVLIDLVFLTKLCFGIADHSTLNYACLQSPLIFLHTTASHIHGREPLRSRSERPKLQFPQHPAAFHLCYTGRTVNYQRDLLPASHSPGNNTAQGPSLPHCCVYVQGNECFYPGRNLDNTCMDGNKTHRPSTLRYPNDYANYEYSFSQQLY